MRIENSESEIEIIRPLRELAKIKEKVKSITVKNVIKNKGITPNV